MSELISLGVEASDTSKCQGAVAVDRASTYTDVVAGCDVQAGVASAHLTFSPALASGIELFSRA
ncbi:hypothetical protein [Rhodococcus globerulus]|uniref:hypothetical protein n=1 Tax=Rhodococcus globerulus TaxID=33008 RepID=UPI0005271698|nr:hypothetical protein [Rhodococcus globerulus]NMD60042.1 hypothetical protein [Nocardia globerula]